MHEQAVHSCHFQGDMAVRMREVLARRWFGLCVAFIIFSISLRCRRPMRVSFEAIEIVRPGLSKGGVGCPRRKLFSTGASLQCTDRNHAVSYNLQAQPFKPARESLCFLRGPSERIRKR